MLSMFAMKNGFVLARFKINQRFSLIRAGSVMRSIFSTSVIGYAVIKMVQRQRVVNSKVNFSVVFGNWPWLTTLCLDLNWDFHFPCSADWKPICQ